MNAGRSEQPRTAADEHSTTRQDVSAPAATVAVREVAAADFPQWAPLWAGYNSFYEREVPDAVTQATWSRFFEPIEPVHALVAEQDGRLLGLVHYLFHRATAMIEMTCYLADLFTNEAARGKGVGKRLIEETRKAAGGAQTTTLLLSAPTAMTFYQGIKMPHADNCFLYRREK